MLRQIAPGVVWVAALLAAMLSVTQLYATDHADGSLEQMLLVPGGAASRSSLAKAVVALAPDRPAAGRRRAAVRPAVRHEPGGDRVAGRRASLLGTPVLSLLGGLGAALTLGLRSGAVLLILIIVPLCIPALIFGAGAVGGGRCRACRRAAHYSLLGALLIFTARAGAGGDGGRAAHRHRMTPDRPTTVSTTLRFFRFASPARVLSARRQARAVVRRRRRGPRRDRPVPRHAARADRRDPGRRLPDHLHPRPGGLDVDAALRRDGVLGGDRLGLQRPAGLDRRARDRADRRDVHLPRPVDRRALGQADLGRLVGLGRAPDLRADPALPLRRLPRPGLGDRRHRAAPTAPARCSRSSAASTCRSSISR